MDIRSIYLVFDVLCVDFSNNLLYCTDVGKKYYLTLKKYQNNDLQYIKITIFVQLRLSPGRRCAKRNNIVNTQIVCPKVKKSFVNGTNGREAYLKRWIAILVQMNCEKKTSILLNKAGYETYIPIQQEIHQWSDRKKKVNRLIIPMVVFVRATVREEEWLRNQSYIYKLIALPGSDEDKQKFATPIPDYQIDRLKFMLENAETEVTIVSDFDVGDSIFVIDGPLKGLKGVVSESDDKHSLFGVFIDGLGYACVRIARRCLTVR